MKKLFGHGVFGVGEKSGLGFEGILRGGAHGLLPGASPKGPVFGKVGVIGVMGTPTVHWGSVPLGSMVPRGGAFASVLGRHGSLRTFRIK